MVQQTPMLARRAASAALMLSTVLFGCVGARPEGIAPTSEGVGPVVIFDPFRRPEPEVPFPNDAGTLLVGDTPTGRRVNVSVESPLDVERLFRTQLNRLDGWSILAPITVSFDAPIDLTSVADDTVLLYDVTEGSQDGGRALRLDLGKGAWPMSRERRGLYPFGPDGDLPDLWFARNNEVDGERVEHWEVETNTLIIRPMMPLRHGHTYAVVLTRGLVGLDGEAIRSPFDGVNEPSQTHAVERALPHLPAGAGPETVAFAWSFTTGRSDLPLQHIREGLDGEGPLAWLADEHTPAFALFDDMATDADGDGSRDGIPEDDRDHRWLLQAPFMSQIMGLAGGFIAGTEAFQFDDLDHLIFGTFRSVDLRSDEDLSIWVDAAKGTVDHTASEVPFLIAIPKESDEHKQPFDVVVHAHATSSSRVELAAVANAYARRGLASICIDGVGHGPIAGDIRHVLSANAEEIPPDLIVILGQALGRILLDPKYSTQGKDLDEMLGDMEVSGLWRGIATDGRAEDLDGDGVVNSGDGYLVPNPFQLSSATMQTTVDNMVALRLLQSLDGEGVPSEPIESPRDATYEELLPHLMGGDFDANGVPDLGGPDARYYVSGVSMGGFHSSMLAAAEPTIRGATVIVSGGGLSDLIARTGLRRATQPILMEASGVAVVGCPTVDAEGEPTVALTWSVWSDGCDSDFAIEHTRARSDLPFLPILPGGSVTLRNPWLETAAHGEHAEEAAWEGDIAENGGFMASVGANVGDTLELRLFDAEGTEVEKHELTSPLAGLGRRRNSPRFRRLMNLAQVAIDRSDPLAYARSFLVEPPEGFPTRNILHIVASGDDTVTFAQTLAYGRAAGLFGDEQAALETLDRFIERDAIRQLKPYEDVDGHFEDTEDPLGPFPAVETDTGLSAIRFARTDNHEYILGGGDVNWGALHVDLMATWLGSDMQSVEERRCLLDSSCE